MCKQCLLHLYVNVYMLGLFCVAGIVNRLLSWSALVPLSRLTYMAYLVHPTVMFWYYTNQEMLFFLSDINFVS